MPLLAVSRSPPLIDSRFEVNTKSRLGDGGFGEVFRGRDRKQDPPVDIAAKRVPLTNHTNKVSFDTECGVLKKVCEHQGVISLFGDFKKGSEGWLFLEVADGGELFERLQEAGKLSERAAWPYFRALANAVQHCHSKGVVHRDLKLENVMLVADDPLAVRIIDFGLAVQLNLTEDGKIDPSETRRDTAGTQAYRAPEMNGAAYDPAKVDVWALGIILFSLCAGFFPLKEANPDVDWRFRKLVAAQQDGAGACDTIFAMYKRTCPFSLPMKAMLDAMLAVDPKKRIGMREVLAEPWLQKEPTPPAPRDDDDTVYRGSGLDDEEYVNDCLALDEPPEDAPLLERQKACFVGEPEPPADEPAPPADVV